MRVTSWIFLLLALAALGVVGGSLLSQTESEPRELLESALRRANGPEQDHKGAIRELDQALVRAELAGDRELIADILTARGNFLRTLRAIGPAEADFRRVLEEFRPEDVSVKLQVVALQEAGGELEGALELIQEVTREHPGQSGAWTLSGKVLMALSQEKMREVAVLLDGELTDEDAFEALGTIRLATGMDPSDPLRVSLLHNVRTLFASGDQLAARTVLSLVDEISQQNAAAREALVRSFQGG